MRQPRRRRCVCARRIDAGAQLVMGIIRTLVAASERYHDGVIFIRLGNFICDHNQRQATQYEKWYSFIRGRDIARDPRDSREFRRRVRK